MSTLVRVSTFAFCSAAALFAGMAGAGGSTPASPLYSVGGGAAQRTGQSGTALVVSGDKMFVGAPTADLFGANPMVDVGYVLIHTRVDGSWIGTFGGFAPPSEFRQVGMRFGAALAVSGDAMIVGAPGEDVNGDVDSGAIYLYRRNVDGVWMFEARHASSIIQAEQRLGSSVAISPSYAVAGAPGYNQNCQTVDTGRVQFLRRDTTASDYLIDGGALTPFPDGFEAFGSSVHLQDLFIGIDRLFVGAPNRTLGGFGFTGATSFYERSGGSWVFRQTLAPAIAAGDLFGSALATSGDYLLVGSRGRDRPGGPIVAGSVRVHLLGGNGLYAFDDELFADDAQASASFGSSLAVRNTQLVVGAPQHNGAAANSGRAYVFDRRTVGPDTLYIQSKVLGSGVDEAAGDLMGISVAVSAEEFFTGVPQRATGAFDDGGVVQIYDAVAIFTDGFETLQ